MERRPTSGAVRALDITLDCTRKTRDMLWWTKVRKRKALVAVGVGTCAVLIAFGVHSLNERIGQENSNCEQSDRFQIPNGHGKVISAYTTVCTTLGTSVVSYVFVHDVTDHPRSANLVFRYNLAGGAYPVELNWADPTHIVVKVRDVRDIELMEEQVGAISIRYVIERAAP